MQQQEIHTHQFPNGLMLIVEPMKDVRSAAFSFLLPSGSVYDQPGCCGTASILTDWITRGAGEYDNRQLCAVLDNLGLQRSESAGSNHVTFGGATVADRLADCLKIYGDIILRPHLPEDQFEPVMMGAEQALLAIDDEPQRKAMIELRRRAFSHPWGLPSDGDLDDLANITPEIVRSHYKQGFRPNGAIIAIAGNVDPQAMIETVGAVFGDWQPGEVVAIQTAERRSTREFIQHESTQTHIGIAYESVSFPDPDYYSAWAAVSILSGGMSSRLFTEVRERRGLCYSVYASQASIKTEGHVLAYAGTSNERAQETLDVTLQELARIGEGIEESELERCKARAKSSLVMQQESTRGRASSLARNWFFLGRIRSLQEVRDKIESLTVESILEYVHRKPAQDFTVLTIGPEALTVPE
jgi:predicted Zn-dependent peptidase